MDLSRVIARICRKYGVADLYVFGSRAREIAELARNEPAQQPRPESDVDIKGAGAHDSGGGRAMTPGPIRAGIVAERVSWIRSIWIRAR